MTGQSTIRPFEAGDVFAGVTNLNNPDDNHAGAGRIIQFDSNLNQKGTIWTEGTTHLIGGLKFAPDKVLWAFDSQGFKVLRFDANGLQLPGIDFAARSFSNVNFASDGTIYFGEHMVGDTIKLPPDRPLGTVISYMPDTGRYGDGHVFQFTPEGKFLRELATETHGGLPGFLGVTAAVIAPDGITLIYISELGNRIFRYDLRNGRQLPDLVCFDKESGNLIISIAFLPDGTLIAMRANFRASWALQLLDDEGSPTREYAMEGPGWGNLCPSADGQAVYIGNFFTGTIARMQLDSGEISARAETNTERSLAGIAQF